MGRSFYVTLLILLFLTGFTIRAKAESIPAKVSADEVRYDYELKQVEATGNVKIEYKNVKVEADYVLLDQDEDILLATGKVVVNNKNDTYRGDRFLYYLRTEQGMISPLNSIVTDPEIRGPVYLTAKEAFIKGEDIKSKHSTFTSCDRAHPHYHFSANKIDYYAGDKILMYHVWYWEGSVPLMYSPFLYISLKKDSFKWDFGKTETEGWYVDTVYYYYFIPDRHSWGNIHTRLTEYGGNFYQVENSKYTSPTGSLTQRYGFLDKQNMTNPKLSSSTPYEGKYQSQYNDYMFGYEYQENLKPKVVTTQKVTNWHHFTQDGTCYLDNTYYFNLNNNGSNPGGLTLDFSDKGLDTYRKINLSTNWNYKLDQTTNLSLNGQWYFQGYLKDYNPNISRSYNLNATKSWPGSQVKPAQNQEEQSTPKWPWPSSTLNLRVSETQNYNNTSSSSTNVKPDLLYTIPSWQLPKVGKIELKAQYTKMEKFNWPTTASTGERSYFSIRKLPITLWNKGKNILDTDGFLHYHHFLVDNQMTELSSAAIQLGYKYQFTKPFSTKYTLGYANTVGQTNTYFGYEGDTVQPGAYLKNDWNYGSETVQASLSAQYNFYTKKASPVPITVNWFPRPKQTLYFNTIYDWYQQGLGQTNLNYNYNPNANWLISLALGYDFSNLTSPWTMQQFTARVSEVINDKWSFALNASYNYLMNKFTTSDYSIFYDWHCRKVIFRYDGVNYIYEVLIYIKAFPAAKLRFSSEKTWENILNDTITE